MYEICMPKFGATMTVGELTEWKVKVGDHVERGDVVAVVTTEKITNDVVVYATGTVTEILVQEGEEAPISAVLARVEKD